MYAHIQLAAQTETQTETQAETQAKTQAKTQAEQVEKTQAEQAQTQAQTQTQTQTQTQAETQFMKPDVTFTYFSGSFPRKNADSLLYTPQTYSECGIWSTPIFFKSHY